MEFQKIAAEIDFNRVEDKEEFGTEDRIVRVNRFAEEDGQDVLGITFELGRQEDDSMNLILPYPEFLDKIKSLERM